MHALRWFRSVEGAGGLVSRMPCRLLGWLPSDEAVCRFPCCGVARNRNGIPASGVPAAAFTSDRGGHRVHHWNRPAQGVAHGRGDRRRRTCWSASSWCVPIAVNASGCCAGRRRLSRELWAVEGATGTARCWRSSSSRSGETVVDVPAALSARARLLDSGRKDKTDAHDARSAAIVALRHRNLRVVALRGSPAGLAAVGATSPPAHRRPDPCDLSAACRARRDDRRRHCPRISRRNGPLPSCASSDRPTRSAIERKRIAIEFLDEVRRHDHALVELHRRIVSAVTAANTTVTDVFGVGPIVAAYLIGYSGDIRRFPTAGHYARYNATAPIEASSGPKVRHRLNPNGNRQLNHAIHIAALGQISHDTPGRAYYLRKQTEGKSRKEAMRCLKRRISDAVYRRAPRRHSATETKRAREGNQGRL